MEPEGSSPYTQEPATCPYPEPHRLSLRSPTQPLGDLKHHLYLPLLSETKFHTNVKETHKIIIFITIT
jgi:hypothetical protein